MLKNTVLYFVVGGVVTTAIVRIEASGHRFVSGFATLMPIFTVVSYLFIGEDRGGEAVSKHAWMVLGGTLVSWVPYMIVVAALAPKLGPSKAIASGLGVFAVLAFTYLAVIQRFRWFS